MLKYFQHPVKHTLEEGLFLLLQIFICGRVFIVTRKHQKFPHVLQKTEQLHTILLRFWGAGGQAGAVVTSTCLGGGLTLGQNSARSAPGQIHSPWASQHRGQPSGKAFGNESVVADQVTGKTSIPPGSTTLQGPVPKVQCTFSPTWFVLTGFVSFQNLPSGKKPHQGTLCPNLLYLCGGVGDQVSVVKIKFCY